MKMKMFIFLQGNNYTTLTRDRQKNKGLYIHKLKLSGGGWEFICVKCLTLKTRLCVIEPLEEAFKNEITETEITVYVQPYLENIPFPFFFPKK